MIMKQVVVIGSANYDIILKVPSLPEMGETLPAEEMAKRTGGKGANQAVQLAKLGIPTYFVGCVGSDEAGRIIRDNLEKYGVRTDFLRTVSGNTGMGIVHVLADGSVFATIERGANYRITKADIDAADECIKMSEYMVLQLEIPHALTAYAIEKAQRYGVKVVLNAAPAEKLPGEIMGKADYLAVNEVEAGFYLKQEIHDTNTAMRLLPRFRKKLKSGMTILCTLGKQGAVICGDCCVEIPPVKNNVIETTGAEDSFLGGFVYSLCKGKNNEEAGRFAACCSAITISRVGAQEAMPDMKEIINKYGEI